MLQPIEGAKATTAPLQRQYQQWRKTNLKNTSIAQFAKRCGVDRARMSKFLRGKALPSLNEAVTMMVAMQCQFVDILEVNYGPDM